MKQTTDSAVQLHVMLAEDGDDRFFFNKSLKALPVTTPLTKVEVSNS